LLWKAYRAMKDYPNALKYHELYKMLGDSVSNAAFKKSMIEKETKYILTSEQEKKDVIAQKELQKQKLVRNGFIAGFAVVLLFAVVFFSQRLKINKEKKRSDDLLLNILPYEVAEELKLTGHCKAKTFSMATVMFMDFKDFTSVSEKVSAELLVDEINYCFSAFDKIIQKYKVEKIKTVGDAYICVSGLPVLNFTHAVDVVNAAIEVRNFMLDRKKEKESRGEIPFELRIGIHTGPVVAGIVGLKKFQYDIWGDTVNLAARMESSGEAGQVNISGSTYVLVKEKFNCTHRGRIQAKNKGEVAMYFVE
jgi:adenylate cyclase